MTRCEWLIAHNAGFDRPLVERSIKGLDGMRWACTMSDINWNTRRAMGVSLPALCASMGLWYDAHRAMEDARACAAMTQALDPEGTRERRLLGAILDGAERAGTRIGIEARIWPGDESERTAQSARAET